MPRKLLLEPSLGKGLRMKIHRVEPIEENEPSFLMAEGWGNLHQRIPDWINIAMKLAKQEGLRHIAIIGPKNELAEAIVRAILKDDHYQWVWIGNNKIVFHNQLRREPLCAYPHSLVCNWTGACIWEQQLDMRKSVLRRQLEVDQLIRKEELLLRRFPVVCRVSGIGIVQPVRKNPYGVRASDIVNLPKDYSEPIHSHRAFAACLTGDLKRGLLMSDAPPIAFSICGKIEHANLRDGLYTNVAHPIQILLSGGVRNLQMYVERVPNGEYEHPATTPFNYDPEFIPLWERLKK